MHIRDEHKKKSYFQVASNRSIKELRIEVEENIYNVLTRHTRSYTEEIEILRKKKVISDKKLNSEFKSRAPKEIVDKEIKKNKEITKKLKLLTN